MTTAEIIAAFAAGATDAQADAAALYLLSLPEGARAAALRDIDEQGTPLDVLAVLARMELRAGRNLNNQGQ